MNKIGWAIRFKTSFAAMQQSPSYRPGLGLSSNFFALQQKIHAAEQKFVDKI
jgi:hypothetical protein